MSIRELLLLAQHGGKAIELPLNGDAAQTWRTGDGAYKVKKNNKTLNMELPLNGDAAQSR